MFDVYIRAVCVLVVATILTGCQSRYRIDGVKRVDHGTGRPIDLVVESFGSQRIRSAPLPIGASFVGLEAQVQVLVSGDAKIVSAGIYRSSGNTAYDQMAVDFVKTWTFKKRAECMAKPCEVVIPVAFE